MARAASAFAQSGRSLLLPSGHRAHSLDIHSTGNERRSRAHIACLAALVAPLRRAVPMYRCGQVVGQSPAEPTSSGAAARVGSPGSRERQSSAGCIGLGLAALALSGAELRDKALYGDPIRGHESGLSSLCRAIDSNSPLKSMAGGQRLAPCRFAPSFVASIRGTGPN
jgi:hypothetical protein